MKKHKNKIIAAVVIVAALSTAWFFGGNYNKRDSDNTSAVAAQTPESPMQSAGAGDAAEPSAPGAAQQSQNTSAAQSQDQQLAPEHSSPAQPAGSGAQEPGSEPGDDGVDAQDSAPEEREQSGEAIASEEERVASEQSAAEENAAQSESGSDEAAEPPSTMEAGPSAGRDTYQTSPVPSGRPAPVEPQDAEVGDGSFTVTLSVHCDTILDNMNLLNNEKHELVPADGVIFPATAVTAYEGESVFNILQREMRRAGIHMTFRNTPIYNSAYIEAINNLYEFDVGELSGWMYKVNDWYPNYGCSRYQLEPGDVIVLNYTCDLGRDLPGAGWIAGNQAGE
ncbi:MAG: DUF4430 domain-containing protein [Oscillospiraceae bacterium]|nr:DUF4430 domain-containing protein [Oscillospiraceae bacterium]